MSIQTVEVGDLFRDNDDRLPAPRIVRVLSIDHTEVKAVVETVEHWDEKRIGKRTRINLYRLQLHKNQTRGYTKVSH